MTLLSSRMRSLGAVALGALALCYLSSVVAQAPGSGGVLFPDWSKPTKGAYDSPSDTLGTKPSAEQPWSVTTVTSSIQGKTVSGKPISVVGEIIDLSCYLQVGKHGDKHRDCGQKCVRNGQPVGLLTADGTIYLLMDEEHDPRRDGMTWFRQKAVDYMAYVVTVNGTFSEVAGQKAIYVQGFLKK
jgi:hypothetical protein